MLQRFSEATPRSTGYRRRPVPGGPGAEKIVGLTAAGLIAAAEALGDDREMGGHARGAGRTGAPHAMLVNEIVVNAVTGTTTHDAPPRTDPRQAPPRRTLPCGPLPGGLDAWATEAPHTITGKHTIIPDAVLRAPELGIPVLFLELDRGTMTDIADVAAKLNNYKRWFDKTVKDTDGYDRTIFEVTYGTTHDRRPYGYYPAYMVRPPVAFVLDPGTRGSRPRFTPDALRRRMKALRDATSDHWAGMRHGDEGVTYYTTVQLGVHMIRTVLPDTPALRCEGRALHVGRTTATAEARVVGAHDGRLYAHGTTTCAILRG
ncbi:replication-relaxation family protein [Kitasatospora sp. NPDC085879]|uniref:PaaI family thioesterase n=1 Tax=Kitasatospora sp. NPDC085879 TaxID=3154769 RepID=UPI00341B47C6